MTANLTCPRCGYPVPDKQTPVRCPRCNYLLRLPAGCPGECGKCLKKRRTNLTTEDTEGIKDAKKIKVRKKQLKIRL